MYEYETSLPLKVDNLQITFESKRPAQSFVKTRRREEYGGHSRSFLSIFLHEVVSAKIT